MNLRLVLSLVAFAVLLALLVPATGHGDLYVTAYNTSLALTDHPNVYQAVADEPTAVMPNGLSGAPYGPLFYYPMAGWLALLDATHLIDVHTWQPDTYDSTLSTISTNFLLKLPYLAVYFLVALVLMKTFAGKAGRTASMLWLVNPAVILYGLLMGQNDGWAFLTAALALLFAVRWSEGREIRLAGKALPLRSLAMVALAIGGAMKLAPVLLVVPFALTLGNSWRERSLLSILGLGVFGLFLLPFAGTSYFWDYGLFGMQTGKATPADVVALAALYSALIFFLATRRVDSDRRSMVVFVFLAVHAVIYLLPDWNPQRSILLIGALSLAVPMRRVFLAPYLVVTAYALALTLGHGGELGAGLFAPLTERALDVPPIDDFFGGSILKTSLLWLGIVVWLGALFQFRRSRREPAIDFAPPTMLMPLLALTLAGYLFACFALAPLGVERTPFVAAASQEVPAGQPLTVTFFAQQRDWRGFAFPVLSGDGKAQVSLLDGAGQPIVNPTNVDIAPGNNWVDMPNDIASRPQPFSTVIVPEQPLTIEMAQVPENLPIAWSDLAGEPLPGAPAFTLRFEASWHGLMSDAGSRTRDEWPTFALSIVVCLGFVATLYTTGLRAQKSTKPFFDKKQP